MEGANKRQPKYKNLLHGALYVEKVEKTSNILLRCSFSSIIWLKLLEKFGLVGTFPRKWCLLLLGLCGKKEIIEFLKERTERRQVYGSKFNC